MGPGDPGKLLIVLAFAFNIAAMIGFFMVARGQRSYRNLAMRSYQLFTGFAVLAGVYLYYLFFTHNFAISYVWQYSSTTMPLEYLISAFWAGQEGTYLLWLIMNAAWGFLILKYAGRYRDYAMAVYGVINCFFLVLLVKLSPFAYLDFFATEGNGLNPLLQDPWMVIHPPVIFVGYSMAAVPFAIAMSAMIIKDYSSWLERVFPWVTITALMLAAGNILGGYWAYKTLGWGGFWAWDPVENSSFIPWFVSLALVHGLIIEKRSGALRRTNLMMTSFVFLLIVYGTFLTRSGVLSDFSVHSFVDLGLNNILVGFMALFVAMTLGLFIPRARSIESKPMDYNYFGKQFILFGGMMLLFLFSVVVLFWTSLPVLTSIFQSDPRAADLKTYNEYALPFGIMYAMLLTVSPWLTFNDFKLKNWQTKLSSVIAVAVAISFGLFYFGLGSSLDFALVLTLVITGLTMYFFKSDLRKSLMPAMIVLISAITICVTLDISNYMYILFFATAGMAIISNFLSLFGFLPGRWKYMGGELSHFGFGLMLLGCLGSAGFDSNVKLNIERGQTDEAYGLTIGYLGMANDIETPKNELILTIDDGTSISEARPQLYYSKQMDGIMRKPYIMRSLLSDLYFSPEQIQEIPDTNGLRLIKGTPTPADHFVFTFLEYSMGEKSEGEEGMRVIATIVVEHHDVFDTLYPAVLVTTDENGISTQIDEPAHFTDHQVYDVRIDEILPDEGAIVLTIPGLKRESKIDRLILDVARKPLINLVWWGTTLIMLGAIIVYIRRREELKAQMQV